MRTEPERREEQIVEEAYIVDNRSTPEASNIEVNEEEPRREKVKQEIKICLLFTCIVSKEIPFHWYFVSSNTLIDGNLLETNEGDFDLNKFTFCQWGCVSFINLMCCMHVYFRLDKLGQIPFAVRIQNLFAVTTESSENQRAGANILAVFVEICWDSSTQ